MLGLLSQTGPVNANVLSRNAAVTIGDYWTLNRSQVYRELEGLERRGYVLAGPTGSRSSRAFRVTRRGAAALDHWLMSGPTGEVVRMPILLSIRFGARLPRERLREILEEFTRRHEAQRSLYSQLEDELRHTHEDPYALATLRFGIAFETAVSTWLDDLRDILPETFESSLDETQS